MSETKHTPGPWEVVDSRNGRELDILGDRHKFSKGGDAVVWLATVKGNATSQNVTAANAGLIAAAPDLLEACKKANTCASLPDAVRELCRDAIAKATGNG